MPPGEFSTNTSHRSVCFPCLQDQMVNDTGCIQRNNSDSQDPRPENHDQKSWFMQNGLSSTIFKFAFTFHFFILFITIVLQNCTVDQGDIRFIGKCLLPMLWIVYNMAFMSARFNWFLTSSEARVMKAYYVSDNPDRLVWLLSKDDYQYNRTCAPHSSLSYIGQEALCKFGIYEFTTSILGDESSYENISSKLSVGLGLIIWACISFYMMMKDANLETKTRDRDCSQQPRTVDTKQKGCFETKWTWLKRKISFLVISTALSSQQSLVLLPLTSMEITPHCYELQSDLPVTSRLAACWHKWSIAGIPYGVPSMAAGTRTRRRKRRKEGCTGCIAVLLYVTGVSLFFIGVGLVVFWLFGGIIIGTWFTYSSTKILVDLALTKTFAPVFIVVSCDFILPYAIFTTRCARFRVPRGIGRMKMKLFHVKARVDGWVSSSFRELAKKYLPCGSSGFQPQENRSSEFSSQQQEQAIRCGVEASQELPDLMRIPWRTDGKKGREKSQLWASKRENN
ncbi:hypothetical protein GUITHDRAFT_141389 [Guillardia theta CCMP2712]|uniref:Uncharacterized protein n=1 Tax=Guillardia theta (strain CCMP2712) TaxID=905079 RepID=L1J0Y8_GUITC|nr:hypothetical protein GUITHDRAFT_141389 [Guillardia theta CCMP2712]EKX42186.1 hypothetical protein GUITHDRAFT_141389 [Guillardia theta CCMP2712]|eukprot:XP_005829166.1 hypothetical protein GUITHDRAFT_141389 [Guillardia theta CCMP2712]